MNGSRPVGSEGLRAFCGECFIECVPTPECWLVSVTKPKQRLCQMCFAVYRSLCDLPYFIELHQEWLKDERRKDRLRPGGDYFA